MRFRHRHRPRPPYRPGHRAATPRLLAHSPRPAGVGRRLLRRLGLRLGEHLLFNPAARERARALLADLAELWDWWPLD